MTGNQTHLHFGDLAIKTSRRLALALGVTGLFVVIEIFAGLIGNSLALLTDAAHNFTDVIALGLSWYALRLASQPANAGKTFGYHRAGILVALVNSSTLVLISLGIFYEAYRRLISPSMVNAPILIGVGMVAFVVNAWTAWLAKNGSDQDLNLRSAFLHLMGDVLSTVGAVLGGILILFTKWNWLDPMVSVLIGALILWNAWGILRQTIHILLESAPENINLNGMLEDLLQVEGVRGVHDLHVWSISQSLQMLSAHIVTDDVSISAALPIQEQINSVLEHKYKIRHATLQMECEGCHSDILFCDIREHHREQAKA
jgi:cobalt-zinc-cadmium efflux system protein